MATGFEWRVSVAIWARYGYGLLVDEGYLLHYRMQASSIFLLSLAQAAVYDGNEEIGKKI